MPGYVKKLWQWFVNLIKEIFGVSNPDPPAPTSPTPTPPTPSPTPPAPTPTPTPAPPSPAPTPPAPTPTPPATGIMVMWINQSQGTLSDADAARIVQALNAQVPHLMAFWPTAAVTHELLATGATPPSGSATLVKAYFLLNADVAGALGYHDTDPQGDPYIRVFTETVLQNGGSALSGSLSISACASHEACEEALDPSCQATATAPNGDVWALELSDPVQDNSYDITIADETVVAVSDFVTPAFFGQPSVPGVDAKQYDYLKVLSAPFTIASGGYAIIGNQAVYGENYRDKGQNKDFPASRTYKRLHATGR